MKKLFAIIAAFAACASPCLRADTSYLLIQGPFGAGGLEATFKWQVNYQAGVLGNGQALLNAVFGTPALNGIYTDAFATQYYRYTSGGGVQGVGFIDFGTDPTLPDPAPAQPVSPFLVSVTLGSATVAQASDYSVGWNYYVAGGGSAQSYPNAGTWSYSDDGGTTRTLANGSYDAWVYGNTFPAASINGATNTPTTPNFSGATVVNVVPEPASAALLALGAGAILALPRRRRS